MRVSSSYRWLGLLALVTLSMGTHAQNAYVCVADKSTGFSFDANTKQWSHARFNVTDMKFVLHKNQGIWTWSRPGTEMPAATCPSEFNDAGFLHCTGFESVMFHKGSLRFQSIYAIGYVRPSGSAAGGLGVEGADTPSITIGRCTPL